MNPASESRQVVIACRDVEVAPGDLPILSELSFELCRGESMAVTGPSGSGKTTLLHCLAGLRRANRGQIWLLGHDLGEADNSHRSRLRGQHVGIVLQFGELLPELTVAENVALPVMLAQRGTRRAVAAQVAGQLEGVGLAGFEDRWPASLSGGEIQRVAIARALVGEPALILADEPTGSLDPVRSAEITEVLLTAVTSTGAALIVATHNPTVAARCDRQLRIEDRRLIRA